MGQTSVSDIAVRSVLSSAGPYQGACTRHLLAQEAGDPDLFLPRRHLDSGVYPLGGRVSGPDCSPNVDAGKLYHQPEEIRPDTGPGFGLHWRAVSDGPGTDFLPNDMKDALISCVWSFCHAALISQHIIFFVSWVLWRQPCWSYRMLIYA